MSKLGNYVNTYGNKTSKAKTGFANYVGQKNERLTQVLVENKAMMEKTFHGTPTLTPSKTGMSQRSLTGWEKLRGSLTAGWMSWAKKGEALQKFNRGEEITELEKEQLAQQTESAKYVAIGMTEPLKSEVGLIKKLLTSTTKEGTTKILKEAGVADDLATAYATKFTKANTINEVKQGIESLNRIQTRTKLAAGKAAAIPERMMKDTRGETTRFLQQAKAQRLALDARRETTAAVARTTNKLTAEFQERLRTQQLTTLKAGIKQRNYYSALLTTARAAFKARLDNLQSIKKEIYTFAKENLPLEVRGKLLANVAKAKTPGDLSKGIRKVIVERNNVIKRDAIDDIIQIADAAQSLPQNQKDKVINQLSSIDLSRLSTTKRKELEALKTYLKTEPTAVFRFGGKNVGRVNQMERLDKTPLADMGLKDILKLRDSMEHAFNQGKVVDRVIENTKNIKTQEALDVIERTSRNMDEGLPVRDPMKAKAERGTAKQVMDGAIRKGELDFSSPDVGFQILDNEIERGTNWKTFKRPIDIGTGKANQLKDELYSKLYNGINQIEQKYGTKFTEENYHNVMLWATINQVGGREKLLKTGLGFTEAKLDSVRLTEAEREFYDLGRSIFDEIYPQLDAVKRRVDGEALPRVENYWSWMTDFENSEEVFNRINTDFNLRTRTTQGFTKTRSFAGKQTVNLNSLDVLTKHIDDASKYIHLEETLREVVPIAQDPRYPKSVGKMGQKWVLQWLDLVARGGTPKGYKPGIISTVSRNVGHAILGFKLSPIIKQPLAKIVSGSFLGTKAFTHDVDFLNTAGLREAIHNVSKQQKFRSFDDPSYVALAKNKKLAKWQETGYAGIKYFDSLTADSVWYAAYRKSLDDKNIAFKMEDFLNGKVDNDSAEWADLITRRSQGSSEAKDSPMIFMKEGQQDIMRALLQFQRFTTNQALIYRDAVVALQKEKDPAKAGAILAWMTAAGLAETYVTTGLAQITGTEQTASDEAKQSFMDRVFKATIGQMPFLSNIYSISEYGGTGIPALDVVYKPISGISTAIGGKDEATQARGVTRAVEGATGLFGISGATQAAQLVRKGIDTISPSKKSQAEKIVANWDTLSNSQRNQKLREIEREDASLGRAVVSAWEDKQSGITDKELEIRKLGVENGERAAKLYSIYKKLDASERGAWVKDLRKKKVITSEVLLQMKKLQKQDQNL